MGEQMAMIELVILAVIAGVILFRLRSVLGRRTGHERPRYTAQRDAKQNDKDNVVVLPRGEQSKGGAADVGTFAQPGSETAMGLTKIQLADRTFDPAGFVDGAKAAYAMIVEAFAKGDRDTLRMLLDPAVLASFEQVIDARADQGQVSETTVVGVRKAEITGAAMDGTQAEVTVTFTSEMISCVRDSENRIVEGDPSTVRLVTDVWTFARNTKSSDPNWALIATGEG